MASKANVTNTRGNALGSVSWVGDRPIVVIGWVNRDGVLQPGHYIELDPAKLRKSTPVGTYGYDGLVRDPRVPARLPH